MRLFSALAIVLLAASAASQPGGAVEDAEAFLSSGDSVAAVRAVDAAIRRGEDGVALRRLRLRLRVDGPGVRGLPRPLRDQQILDAARALLRRAPSDTLALRVLTEEAVWTALNWHDRVTLGHVRGPGGAFVSDEEIRARTGRTKFDGLARRAMAPDLDRSGRADDAREAAEGYLDTWIAEDAAASKAYEAAATLAVLDEDWAGLAALADRFASAANDPRAGLYAGLAAYRLGDADAAEAAFDQALARLAAADRARYEDVRPLLPDSLRAAFDATPEAAAAFWTAADTRLLTDVNERRAEHRARIVEADLLFGRSADDLFQGVAPRGAETSRGRIWVRYGRPEVSVRFMTDSNAVDFYGERDTRLAVWDFEGFRFAFRDPSLSGEYVTYSPPAYAFGATTSAANDDFVMQDERMRRDDPQRTQDLPENPLDVPVLVSRFRAPGGGTDVVVAFGVPFADAPAPIRTGVFALAGGAVVDRAVADRQRLAAGRVVRSQDGPAVWADAASVRLPGAGTVRVEVEAEGGDARGSLSEPVVPLPGGFGVSDLLLATSVDEDGRGPVVRDGLGIVPAPRAVFPTTDPVYVVLEAYGMGREEDGRTRYTVEAELRPEARRGGLLGAIFGRGQGPGVSVRSEAEGTRADETLSFFLDVGDQDPGRYTLTVTVADDVTGRSASAERRVVLE